MQEKTFYWLVAIGFILAGGIGVYAYMDSQSVKPAIDATNESSVEITQEDFELQENSPAIIQKNNQETPVQNQTTIVTTGSVSVPNPKITQPVTGPSSTRECGSDWNCIIAAARACSASAQATITQELDIFGATAKTQMKYGVSAAAPKCSFSIKTLNVDITPAAGTAASSGMQTYAQALEGREGTCLFSSGTELANVMTRWQRGDIESGEVKCSFTSDGKSQCTTTGGDFVNAICSGSYFSNTL